MITGCTSKDAKTKSQQKVVIHVVILPNDRLNKLSIPCPSCIGFLRSCTAILAVLTGLFTVDPLSYRSIEQALCRSIGWRLTATIA
jgi:hypothetical protein